MVEATSPAQIRVAWRHLQDVPKLRLEFDSADFRKWVTVVDSILSESHIPDDLGLNLLIPMMPPEAKRLIYEGGCFTWHDAKDVIRMHLFGDQPVMSTDYLNVLQLRQLPSESLREFVSRIRVEAAKSPEGYEWSESVLTSVFCRGVRDPHLTGLLVRAEVFFSSLTDALRFACEAEKESPALPRVNDDLLQPLSAVDLSPDNGEKNQEEADQLDTEILNDILEILRISRRTRTIKDYRRYLRSTAPGLTPEERKMILDMPMDDYAEVFFVVEMIPWFFPWFCVRFGRPLVTYTAHIPRLGRLLAHLNDGKPIFTPGVWIARVKELLSSATRSKSLQLSSEADEKTK